MATTMQTRQTIEGQQAITDAAARDLIISRTVRAWHGRAYAIPQSAMRHVGVYIIRSRNQAFQVDAEPTTGIVRCYRDNVLHHEEVDETLAAEIAERAAKLGR